MTYWTVDVKNSDCMIVAHGGICRQHSPIDEQKFPTRQMADIRAWHVQQAFPHLTIVVTRHDP